jgi:hypothetical protein
MGKGVFAKCDIALNQEVLEIHRPLVVVLDTPRLKDSCYWCHYWKEKLWRGQYSDLAADSENASEEQVGKLLVCGGCGIVRFCGKVWIRSLTSLLSFTFLSEHQGRGRDTQQLLIER